MQQCVAVLGTEAVFSSRSLHTPGEGNTWARLQLGESIM